jgi:hypothetical protein
MSHSTVLVVVPAAAVAQHGGDLDDALTEILEPFDENKDTPQYVKHTKAEAIVKQREYFEAVRDRGNYAEYLKDPAAYLDRCKGNPRHVEYITTEFPEILTKLDDEDFLYEKAIEWETLDEDGNIVSSYNPKSKWDWYQVGGRWAGCIMNWTETVEHEAKVITPTWTEPAWTEKKGGVDYLQKKDLEQFAGTFAMLTADGEWHEQGRMGWFGMVSDEQPADEWDQRLKQLVEDVADEDWLVVVDVHI